MAGIEVEIEVEFEILKYRFRFVSELVSKDFKFQKI